MKTCISRLLDADILENFEAQPRKSLPGEEICPNESAIERFRSRIKETESHKELKEVISTTNISICGNGGRPRSLGLVKHNDSDTSQRSYQLCALALVRFVYNGE